MVLVHITVCVNRTRISVELVCAVFFTVYISCCPETYFLPMFHALVLYFLTSQPIYLKLMSQVSELCIFCLFLVQICIKVAKTSYQENADGAICINNAN